ncbi:hypothetical protein H1C71_024326 [Ictidomys tridecemlineatus]|nr:hypothetical protein H1C71_024326 [Ictidomys tridecemlineatus]KAG3271532.1 hypothetical protein H1C71_024326 [Ictidomys tridecemlineatus]
MAPSGKSLLARRLGLAAPSPGGGRRRGSGPPSWGLRACEGAPCASPRHTASRLCLGPGLALPREGWEPNPATVHPSRRAIAHRRAGSTSGRAALGLRGARQPLLPEPALPPETRRPPWPWRRRAFRPGAASSCPRPCAPHPQAAGPRGTRAPEPPPDDPDSQS